MWTYVSLNAHVVWEDAHYRVVAHWMEEPGLEPVVLEKSGIVALGGDDGPDAVLLAVCRALQGSVYEGRT